VLGNFEEMSERANDYEKIAEQEYEKGYEKGREDAEV
jgi:flagellar biosynthesis/type III secretory pathway protein FliH